MADVKVELVIKTSERHGTDFCSYECEHIENYTKFPPSAICKITNAHMDADRQDRFERPNSCKYLCGEEVPNRFWSPLKGS
jgi:hypothetical protein